MEMSMVRMEEMCAVAHTILRTIIAAIISAGILPRPLGLKLYDKQASTHNLYLISCFLYKMCAPSYAVRHLFIFCPFCLNVKCRQMGGMFICCFRLCSAHLVQTCLKCLINI